MDTSEESEAEAEVYAFGASEAGALEPSDDDTPEASEANGPGASEANTTRVPEVDSPEASKAGTPKASESSEASEAGGSEASAVDALEALEPFEADAPSVVDLDPPEELGADLGFSVAERALGTVPLFGAGTARSSRRDAEEFSIA